MSRWSWRSVAVVGLLVAAAVTPGTASAIPVFSHKYATSCITCHTVYPKLTQFGEAFRRNGFRFPGVYDSDYIKQEIVQLGQDANKKDFPNAVWPSFITSIPGLGFGLSGSIPFHPDLGSAAAKADGKALVNIDRLATRGSLYFASSIDDNLTFMGFASISDTAASLDETVLVWNDFVGPRHAASLTVGYSYPTLSPFGRSSAYAGGRQLFALSMPVLYGNKDGAFSVLAKYNLAEINGIAGGRFEYGVGLDAGTHVDGVRPPRNYYGHVGVKLGGMRLDGEGNTVASDPAKPWAETAATFYAYVYKSNSRFSATPAAAYPAKYVIQDQAYAYGGGARFQLSSAELSVGTVYETHDHVTVTKGADGLPGSANQLASFGELSYVVYQWLVPALRVEHVTVQSAGGKRPNDTRLLPIVAMMVRQNMKLTVAAIFERCSSIPDNGGDWSASGNSLFLPTTSLNKNVPFQLSSATISASFGF